MKPKKRNKISKEETMLIINGIGLLLSLGACLMCYFLIEEIALVKNISAFIAAALLDARGL